MAMKTLLKEQSLEGIVDPSELAKSGKIRGVDYLFIGSVTNFALKTEKTANQGGRSFGIARHAMPYRMT